MIKVRPNELHDVSWGKKRIIIENNTQYFAFVSVMSSTCLSVMVTDITGEIATVHKINVNNCEEFRIGIQEIEEVERVIEPNTGVKNRFFIQLYIRQGMMAVHACYA